jgi:hypothetical protein
MNANAARRKNVRAIRHYRDWQFLPLVLFVLVLVLSEAVLVLVLSEAVLVLEEKYWDCGEKRAKCWGLRILKKLIALNRFGRFRVRVRVRESRASTHENT